MGSIPWRLGLGALTALLVMGAAKAEDKVLFDFRDKDAAKAWSNIDMAALREAEAKATIAALARTATNPATVPVYRPPASAPAEPQVKIEIAPCGETAGQNCLRLTYAGGRMPTISTPSPLDDWRPYKAFMADVTVGRTCMVVFRAMAATSKYGVGYNDGCSRWEFAARCEKGKNTVVAPAPQAAATLWKNIKTFEIYVYNPRDGEVVYIDNIRLSTDKPAAVTPFNDVTNAAHNKFAVPAGKYKVLGTDLEVKDVDELADKLKDKWVKPEDKTVEQAEADVQAEYDKIKKDHPKAVLAMLRDGQKGYDPANPDKAFAGWADAGTPSHLPMALTLANFANAGASTHIETCFRNRPGFLRVDLSCIPRGAEVLAARLIVARGLPMGDNWEKKPTMFVAEPCNRPWVENEVNVFEYARNKLWKDYAGMTWGEDGDCDAVFLAHGPASGKTCSLDFTEAVKYWTDGKHANNGFILYGSPKYVDYLHIFTREAKEIRDRPCVAVIYEPKD
ncbi:MAG: DNRLRE domain-containing protein [Phycisphaerae bacterium]